MVPGAIRVTHSGIGSEAAPHTFCSVIEATVSQILFDEHRVRGTTTRRGTGSSRLGMVICTALRCNSNLEGIGHGAP